MTSPSPGALQTIRALARNHPVQEFRDGETVFRSAEKGSTMFGVVDGEVRLTWDGQDSWESFGPGTCFGVGALVDPDHLRLGTATAVGATHLLVMDRDRFLFAVQETPMFALELLLSLDERLRELKTRRPA
jgi:CRP-like cAMP-binding protein